jgi:hypothetical protein
MEVEAEVFWQPKETATFLEEHAVPLKPVELESPGKKLEIATLMLEVIARKVSRFA